MIVVRKEDHAKLAIVGIALAAVLAFSGFKVVSTLRTTRPAAPALRTSKLTPIATPVLEDKPIIRTAFAEMPAPNEPNPFRDIIKEGKGLSGKPAMPGKLPGTGPGGITPIQVGGPNIQLVQEPTLRLDGVIAGRGATAIATMGERTEVLSIGASFGQYTLIQVDHKTATFGSKHGMVRLLVGEETKPPTSPAAPVVPKIPTTMTLPAAFG